MVEYPYTTEERIGALAGQMAIDLRLDDSPDAASDLDDAIDNGTEEADKYLVKFAPAAIAQDRYVAICATAFALRWLCSRRLNSVPEGLAKECERHEKFLELVRVGKGRLRIPNSRRAVAVTNHVVDLRRDNNQVRVDRTKSTGVARNYRRPSDPTAPDQR